MKKLASLSLNASLKDLEGIRSFIERNTQELNFDPSATYDVLLAVTEMVTNTIVHGYKGRSGPVEIELAQDGNALVVYLRDQAPPFDPTRVPTPDLSLPLEKRPLGGVGIHLTREFMNRMSYQKSPEWGNELVLVKEGIIPA